MVATGSAPPKAPAPPKKKDDEEEETDLKHFVDSTGFTGPGYALQAEFATERYIWIAILVLFIGLTIKDLAMSIKGYIDSPTSTSTDIRFNVSMGYPDITFCVTFDSNKIDWGLNLRKPEETHALLKKVATTNGGDVLGWLQTEAAVDTSNDGPSNNTKLDSLMKLTMTMLGTIVKLENVKYKKMSEYDRLWGAAGKVGKLYTVDNRTSEAIHAIYKFYAEHNVSFIDLKQAVGQLMLRQMQATINCVRLVKGDKKDETQGMNVNATVTWFGRLPFGSRQERLCFKPNSQIADQINFFTSGDGCYVKVSPQNLYKNHEDIGSTVMFDLNGHNVTAVEVTNMWGLSANVRKQVDIQVFGEYTSLSTPDAPCDASDDGKDHYIECKATCRAKKIYDLCKCWPMSWWHLPDRPADAHYCTQPSGNKVSDSLVVPELTTDACNDTHFDFVVDGACAQKCLRSCHTVIYGYTEQLVDKSIDNDNGDGTWDNRTVIYMDTPTFTYPVLTQSWAFDVNKFFSDLGGNIGLWLGGSIIGAIHLIVFGCRACMSKDFRAKLRSREKRLQQRAAEKVFDRMQQNRISPEQARAQQVALFRYALGNALRAYNLKYAGDAAGGAPPMATAKLDDVDEAMVQNILAQSEEAEAQQVQMQEHANSTSQMLASVMKRMMEQEERIQELEKQIGDAPRGASE